MDATIKIEYPSAQAAAAIQAMKELIDRGSFYAQEFDSDKQVLIISAADADDIYRLGLAAGKYLMQ